MPCAGNYSSEHPGDEGKNPPACGTAQQQKALDSPWRALIPQQPHAELAALPQLHFTEQSI